MAKMEEQPDDIKLETYQDASSVKMFGEVTQCTLRYFPGAYETDYGILVYTRLVSAEGQIHCLLILGKSGVAPLTFISIPRLEPTTAALSVQVPRMMREEIDVHIDHKIFWTNSQLSLDYIKK